MTETLLATSFDVLGGAVGDLLDFVGIDTSINTDDHTILRLQHLRKARKEIHSLVAMEVAYLV